MVLEIWWHHDRVASGGRSGPYVVDHAKEVVCLRYRLNAAGHTYGFNRSKHPPRRLVLVKPEAPTAPTLLLPPARRAGCGSLC